MRTVLLSIVLVFSLAACAAGKVPMAPTPLPEPREVGFVASDGVALKGHVYGTGSIAVVLSNMGDNDMSGWDTFAPALAERGFTVLAYSYRYAVGARGFSSADAKASVSDLEGAIIHVLEGGATKVVLIGASLGGMAASKVAGSAGVAAVVLMASRLDLSDYDFRVTEQELASMTMPKLVLTSDGDSTTAPALTREVFDRAPEPKAFHSFPGTAHGVNLFRTEHKADLEKRLIDFVEANSRG
jgi:pimeloyl-ACP methyl ester carboxylesterase